MKYFFMPVLAICISFTSWACDVCGGASGNYIGILPEDKKHFIGLSCQRQSFLSIHPETIAGEAVTTSQNSINSITAWGSFAVTRKLQLFAFVPYTHNIAYEPAESIAMTGLGDVRILANYRLVDRAGRLFDHSLLLGGGIKLPTGKNTFVNSEGIILSNMQPGTGSSDLIANANYTVRRKRLGINADALYKYSTKNKRDYRYGDKVNVAITGFYWYDAGKISLRPQAGLRYEWSQGDYSSYYYKIENGYSGGMQSYLCGGAGVYIRPVMVSFLSSIPVSQHYADGLIKASARFEIQMQYLF